MSETRPTNNQPVPTAPPESIAPHPNLRPQLDGVQRARFLEQLFDASAPHYDWINRVLSLGTGVRYRREALLRGGLEPGMRVLDVACGTGVISQLATAIVGPHGSVVGVDPSAKMREIARRERGVCTLPGHAEALPVDAGSIDFLVMGYALRHVSDLRGAFCEYCRVLRPGGKLLLLEITAPQHRLGRAFLRFYLGKVIPTIARVGSRARPAQQLMAYHWDSIEQCVRPDVILRALQDAGLSVEPRRVSLGIFSEYSAVRVP